VNYTELKEIVKKHCHLYYDINNPEITDQEFDDIYDQLEKVEEIQGWTDPDSPTLVVGGSAGKIKHPHKLYSLNKVYDKSEIPEGMSIKAPKLDGANLTLIYKNKMIDLAVTRGDGEFGENVTHLTPGLLGIPEYINNDFIINGECVTDNEVDNFRNYVSGALGLLDLEEFKSRKIRFIAHDLLGVEMSFTAKMDILKNAGFHTVFSKICDNYPQDGLVYRINDWQTCKRLGYTSKYPRFAIALKERNSLVATTTLKEVLWVVGRTGAVNPTGVVEPVVLDGATVSRVTLHNMEYIKNHDLGLGDLIELERAGGVIPKFNRVIQHSSHNLKIEQRHAEAAVGHALQMVGPRLYCIDESQHDTVKLLEYFIKTIDIKGLGPASVTKMQLKHPTDLYQFHDWSNLGANGIKIQDEINRSKAKPYETVLASLGIPGVGKSMAKKIVQHIPSFNRLREIETVHIIGIGPKRIEQILAWLDINEEWVIKLPLQLKQSQSIDSVLNSTGVKKVCITGKLDMTRSELALLLEGKGFSVTSTVTKDCYALVSGDDNTSSKYKKAQKQNTKIINYWENRNNIVKGIL